MNSLSSRRSVWIIWGLIAAGNLARLPVELSASDDAFRLLPLISRFLWTIFPIIFSGIGALIVVRQPRNVIGWLLMAPAGAMVLVEPIEAHFAGLKTAPPPTALNFLLLWSTNVGWLLLIFPLLLIILLFPTGRPASRRWGWLIWAILGLPALFALIGLFVQELPNVAGTWVIESPFGFIPVEWLESRFIPVWLVLLAAVTILAAGSLLARYRQAEYAVRQQIKWLLYAGGIFTLYYVPLLFLNDEMMTSLFGEFFDLVLILVILTFPLAIGIAILRYRLYDIALIIRRTVIYTVLTAALAAVYFGSVVLLQQLTEQLTGGQSPLAIVLSTLAIAALFSPLRRRVQEGVDRRFFRQKYDARQVLAQFAHTARDEVSLESLRGTLREVVQQTVQPRSVQIWLQQDEQLQP